MVCQVKCEEDEEGGGDANAICGFKLAVSSDGDKNEGTRIGNLKKHLQRHHPNEFEVVKKAEEDGPRSSKKSGGSGLMQSHMTKFFTSEKVVVSHTKETFKKSLVDIAVNNAISLRVFSTPSFKSLIGEVAVKLKVSLDKDQIRSYIIDAAKLEVEKIKWKLKGQFIFLKFDCATRIRTNYLGLNARFISPTTKLPSTRTLAVVDTFSKHSARDLKDVVTRALDRYEIPLHHVLVCVTDNATNMVKLVSLMDKDLDRPEENETNEDDSSSEDDDSDDDVVQDDNVDNDEVAIDLSLSVPPTIEHMRCAAHTLQLAIHDSLKNSRASALVSRIRKIAIEARTPKINEIVKKRTKKVVILDMETRWGSTFSMVDRLVELKNCIQEIADCGNKNLVMTKQQWDQTVELRDLLKKAFEVTKKLQYGECTPGYFYRKWTGLRLYYENNDSVLAEEIVKSMKKREPELINNGLLIAAVLLDVHNFDLLSESDIKKGREAVVQLVLRLKGLREEVDDDDASSVATGWAMSCPDTDSDEDMRLLRKQKMASVFTEDEELDMNTDQESQKKSSLDASSPHSTYTSETIEAGLKRTYLMLCSC